MTAPTYTSGPATAALPKRERVGGREYDPAEANALLALIIDAGTTATDGVTYATATAARIAAHRASRLVAHVTPTGKRPATRMLTTADGTTWVLYLTDAKAITPEIAAARKAAAAKAIATKAAKAAATPAEASSVKAAR